MIRGKLAQLTHDERCTFEARNEAQVEIARKVPRSACAEYSFAIAEQRFFDPVMLRLVYHTRNLDANRGEKHRQSRWSFTKYMLKTLDKDLVARYDPEWG